MADNSDWYARKLAAMRTGQQAPPPVQPPQYPPTAPPAAPGALPPHLAPYAAQPAPQGYQQQLPGQQPAQQQSYTPQSPAELLAMVQNGQIQGTSYNASGAQVADDGHAALLAVSAGATGGSRLVKENSTVCPNCNRDTLFTVQEGGVFSKLTGTNVKAQQCSFCNWPKIQAGSQGGSLGTAKGSGPATPARQLPRNHRVTVAMPGGGYETFDPPTGA